ncbi:MAG TPA: Ni/Fe-hydrogenase cytochrome b subunit [Acidobacteriota bacterium]|nr:Ni/Fe-hydrogenase cytochrome b subunit [Acidobacteriota bacterium]
MSSREIPVPMRATFFTPGTKILFGVMLLGIGSLVYRFVGGLGAATNLDNGYGWGIWIAIDVACGVALAAGGFTSAALADVFHRERYHVITRPALLTAMLGYTFVALGVLVDLGRFYNIWHPVLPSMWQGNSALFEVGICVMTYLTVLYIEFLPIVVERFKGRVNLPGVLALFNKLVESFLQVANRTLGRLVSLFIIAGVVLSCMHQSSLGTLMILVPTKMHPLWYTPISPLLFLLSAIMVGFPMVIFESVLAARSFKLKPELPVLSSISRYTLVLLGVYLAIRIGDITIREVWPSVLEFSTKSIMFLIEITVGVIVPLILLATRRFRQSVGGLFTAASLVILGIVLNRINVFLVAYEPLYQEKSYFPSIYEILVTTGFIAALILVYRVFVMVFPVISLPADKIAEHGAPVQTRVGG